TAKYCSRSHTCGQLRKEDAGQEVKLYGWVRHIRRFVNGPFFLTLHDAYGSTQLFVKKTSPVYNILEKLSVESVIGITGTVNARPENMINKDMPTGEIEVVVDNVNIVNQAEELPIQVSDKGYKAKDELKLQYRYVDLRSSNLQQNLRLRSNIVMAMRKFLIDRAGFAEVETPTLFKRTPEGAREFLVPTRQPELFYTLVQSPQQFKQLLMVGGLDRYFQFARCYRDEDSRADRQPEFTQLDLEMSFVNQYDIQSLIEDMIHDIWPITGHKLSTPIPFPRMSFADAVTKYGSDKPDVRFDMKIHDITEAVGYLFDVDSSSKATVKASMIVIPGGENKELNQIHDFVDKNDTGKITMLRIREDGSWKGNISSDFQLKLKSQLQNEKAIKPGDLVILSAGVNYKPNLLLGKLRLFCADLLEAKGIQLRDPNEFKFLWVEDFPLFTLNDESDSMIESTHHPFTAPVAEDVNILFTDPLKVSSAIYLCTHNVILIASLSVLGQHYDLVLNGNEVGGGSIRVHDFNLQTQIFEKILKVNASQFKHLLKGLKSGCPPHGGIALGFDRFMAVLCNSSSLRDVIAFPKSASGKDLLTEAPSTVSNEYLSEYHIRSLSLKTD
ncbi:uncharacterized protein TRIADDRAFT_20832, partial [Trichoplax adhaerens]